MEDYELENDGEKPAVEEGRKFGFSILNNEFADVYWRKIGLIPGAVYVILCRFAGGNKAAWPKLDTIADMAGISRSSVKNAIRTLKSHRMVKVKKRITDSGDQQSNLYTLLDKSEWVLEPEGTGSPHDPVTTCPPTGQIGGHQVPPEKEQEDIKKNILSAAAPTDCVCLNPKSEIRNNGHTSGKSTNGTSPESLRPIPGFPIEGTPPVRPPNVLYRCANKLSDAIVRSGVFGKRRPRPAQWESDFRKLIIESDITPEELEGLVDWYCEHIADDHMPEVFSGGAFYKKYEQIEAARNRFLKRQNGSAQIDNEQKVELPAFRDLAPTGSYDDYLKQTGD